MFEKNSPRSRGLEARVQCQRDVRRIHHRTGSGMLCEKTFSRECGTTKNHQQSESGKRSLRLKKALNDHL